MADSTTTSSDLSSLWVYAGIGVIAGLLAGLLGVGGGIVMVPLMVAVGVTQHRAHATSLLAILVIAVAGVTRFAISDEVDWAIGFAVALGAIVGSTFGSKVMGRMSPSALRAFFVVMLVAAGLRMLLGGEVAAGDQATGAAAWAIGVGIGLVSGFAAGVAGVGGGIVIVPALVFLLGMNQHSAEGTSLMVIIFTAIAATRVNLAEKRVDMRQGLVMGASGVISSVIGASLALGMEAPLLTRVFGGFALLVAVRMAWTIRPQSLRPA